MRSEDVDLSEQSQAMKAKKTFLQKGRGFETRVAATQAKRYVPKGGFIKTVEQHLPKVSKLKQIRQARAQLESSASCKVKGSKALDSANTARSHPGTVPQSVTQLIRRAGRARVTHPALSGHTGAFVQDTKTSSARPSDGSHDAEISEAPQRPNTGRSEHSKGGQQAPQEVNFNICHSTVSQGQHDWF